jgi:hypothetical protein
VPPDVGIVDKIVELHRALDAARLPHAFGGALALAWCTERARGTIDIDVNVFVDVTRVPEVFTALPDAVRRTDAELAGCIADGQVRLWWGETPIDVFVNTTDFHRTAADRAVAHEFASHAMPFLSCSDVAVFKAFFDRPRDWADIDEMLRADALDLDRVLGAIVHYLGADDHRVARLRSLTTGRREI